MATDEKARNPQPARLAHAIQQACAQRGWLQEDLIQRSAVSRSTIQRLWSGRSTVKPGPTTRKELEHTLEWEPGTVEALWNGEQAPTPPASTPDAEISASSLRALAQELIARAERLEAQADQRHPKSA